MVVSVPARAGQRTRQPRENILPEPEGFPSGVQGAEILLRPSHPGAHLTHLSRVRPVLPAGASTSG